MSYSPWSCKELDMTEQQQQHHPIFILSFFLITNHFSTILTGHVSNKIETTFPSLPRREAMEVAM